MLHFILVIAGGKDCDMCMLHVYLLDVSAGRNDTGLYRNNGVSEVVDGLT